AIPLSSIHRTTTLTMKRLLTSSIAVPSSSPTVPAPQQFPVHGTGWSLASGGMGGSRGIVSVIGCPVSLGQGKSGVQNGPEYIRAAGLHNKLKATDWIIEDSGDLSIPTMRDTDIEVCTLAFSAAIDRSIA